MGDTGSLGLGGAIAGLAVMTKTEVLLIMLGGIFVIEALSVAIQVISFQTFRKRVFLMAPIHHHFELKAWSETKIILRFWIVASICARSASRSTRTASADHRPSRDARTSLGGAYDAVSRAGTSTVFLELDAPADIAWGYQRPVPGHARPATWATRRRGRVLPHLHGHMGVAGPSRCSS